jgi:hypothetical protein
MDLGFGQANQIVGQATAKALMATAKAQEAVLDEELIKYDALLEDDDALDRLRERRLQQLQEKQKQANAWKDKGHGNYGDLEGPDVAKSFFNASKTSERLVVHFYRPTTQYCKILDHHLQKIAEQHLETKFVRVNVESAQEGDQGATYLVEQLGIKVMPTLVLIHNRKAVHHLRGFDELGGSESFSTDLLKFVLSEHGVMQLTEQELDHYGEDDKKEELLAIATEGTSINFQTVRRGYYDKDNQF